MQKPLPNSLIYDLKHIKSIHRYIYIYIYKIKDFMQKIMRFYHVTHSMKRIEIPLSHIRDKNKFKSSDFLFSLVQCFKTIFVTLLFNVLRLFISHTHKKLFAFPFTLFISTPLYTHVYSLSYHPISNTLRQKTMSFTFNLLMTPT